MVPNSFTLDSLHIRHLERWTVLMYSKNCNAELVNDTRKLMFSHNLRFLDPANQECLILAYQGCPARRSLYLEAIPLQDPDIPKPSEWGWEWNTRTKEWVPYWTDLSDVSQACSLLLRCGCSVACKGNCNCHSARL